MPRNRAAQPRCSRHRRTYVLVNTFFICSCLNSVGGNTATGHEEGHVSKNSTNFAYGAGVIINPMENIAVNIGYEGTQADMDGHKSMNGFNIGVGYRF
ncbi:Ail/Lom family outer membrane beta-barrel protein [Providencia rettgeri]